MMQPTKNTGCFVSGGNMPKLAWQQYLEKRELAAFWLLTPLELVDLTLCSLRYALCY
jgi:hypothetical protein